MAGIQHSVCVLTAILMASGVSAQELSGPLAVPDNAPATPKRPKHAAAHREKTAAVPTRITAPALAFPPSFGGSAPIAKTGLSKRGTADDPVSFGMKWSGSNDSAGQTRIENLNGNAPGTGAEVGLKLHF